MMTVAQTARLLRWVIAGQILLGILWFASRYKMDRESLAF
jgi:hypothetical protein